MADPVVRVKYVVTLTQKYKINFIYFFKESSNKLECWKIQNNYGDDTILWHRFGGSMACSYVVNGEGQIIMKLN